MNCAGAGGESYQIKLETNSNISASTILMGRRGGGRSGLYAASPKLKRTKYGGGAAGAFTDLEASYAVAMLGLTSMQVQGGPISHLFIPN